MEAAAGQQAGACYAERGGISSVPGPRRACKGVAGQSVSQSRRLLLPCKALVVLPVIEPAQSQRKRAGGRRFFWSKTCLSAQHL